MTITLSINTNITNSSMLTGPSTHGGTNLKIEVGESFFSRDNSRQLSVYNMIDALINAKSGEERLTALKRLSGFISSVSFDHLSPVTRERIKGLLRDYFKAIMFRDKKDTSVPADVEAFIAKFSKQEVPHLFFLYTQAFVDNSDTNMIHYGLDYIVTKRMGDCNDISMAAYQVFIRAGIEAKVVKSYLRKGAIFDKDGKPVDTHTICVYKTENGWNYIDHLQLIDKNFASVMGIFCRSSLNKYVERARFVDTDVWSKGTLEAKEPVDGPKGKNEFYDENFFYVRERDACSCRSK